MASVIDTVGQVVQLEADPAGFFRNRQQQQQQEAQRGAQAQILAPLLNQLNIPTNSVSMLPAEQQLQTLYNYQKQQDFGLQQQKEARTTKQNEQEYAQKEKSIRQRDDYNRILESSQRLQQQGLDLRNNQLSNQIEDANDRKQAIKDASEVYQQAIAGLNPTDQLRAKAVLSSAKAKGDFRALDALLKPEKSKPGSPQHLFEVARSGEIDLSQPNSVEDYFKSHLKKDAAKAASANFRSAYFNAPEQLGFFESFYRSPVAPKLNTQGKAALNQQQEQQAQQTIERMDPKTGRTVIFDAVTKQPIRFK